MKYTANVQLAHMAAKKVCFVFTIQISISKLTALTSYKPLNRDSVL